MIAYPANIERDIRDVLIHEQQQRITELETKLAAAELDVKRFRWLLDNDTAIGVYIMGGEDREDYRYLHKEEAIDRIDAAMKEYLK